MKNKINNISEAAKNIMSALEDLQEGVTLLKGTYVIKISCDSLAQREEPPLESYRNSYGEFVEIARALCEKYDNAPRAFPYFFESILPSLMPTELSFLTLNKQEA